MKHVGASPLPSGVMYFDAFISPEEQATLTAMLDNGTWSTELKRRVQHFGYRYDYKARSVSADAYLGPLPQWLGMFAERLVTAGHCRNLPDQVIANESSGAGHQRACRLCAVF